MTRISFSDSHYNCRFWGITVFWSDLLKSKASFDFYVVFSLLYKNSRMLYKREEEIPAPESYTVFFSRDQQRKSICKTWRGRGNQGRDSSWRMESSASLGLLALSSWRWSSFSDQRRQRRRWTVIDGLLPDIVSLSSSCRENAAALHLVSSFNAGSILFPVHQSFQSSLEANWSSHSFFFSPWKSFPAFCVSFPFFVQLNSILLRFYFSFTDPTLLLLSLIPMTLSLSSLSLSFSCTQIDDCTSIFFVSRRSNREDESVSCATYFSFSTQESQRYSPLVIPWHVSSETNPSASPAVTQSKDSIQQIAWQYKRNRYCPVLKKSSKKPWLKEQQSFLETISCLWSCAEKNVFNYVSFCRSFSRTKRSCTKRGIDPQVSLFDKEHDSFDEDALSCLFRHQENKLYGLAESTSSGSVIHLKLNYSLESEPWLDKECWEITSLDFSLERLVSEALHSCSCVTMIESLNFHT